MCGAEKVRGVGICWKMCPGMLFWPKEYLPGNEMFWQQRYLPAKVVILTSEKVFRNVVSTGAFHRVLKSALFVEFQKER